VPFRLESSLSWITPSGSYTRGTLAGVPGSVSLPLVHNAVTDLGDFGPDNRLTRNLKNTKKTTKEQYPDDSDPATPNEAYRGRKQVKLPQPTSRDRVLCRGGKEIVERAEPSSRRTTGRVPHLLGATRKSVVARTVVAGENGLNGLHFPLVYEFVGDSSKMFDVRVWGEK